VQTLRLHLFAGPVDKNNFFLMGQCLTHSVHTPLLNLGSCNPKFSTKFSLDTSTQVSTYCPVRIRTPGRHPETSISTLPKVESGPEFAQDHKSGLRSDLGPVILCDVSELRFWKSPYDFFKLADKLI
jgi:hypothetical protein